MKSFAFLIAGLAISLSSFAKYEGLPQYMANHYAQGTDTQSIQAAMSICRADIAKQKAVVTSKGYSVVEESECRVMESLVGIGSNTPFIQGYIKFIK